MTTHETTLGSLRPRYSARPHPAREEPSRTAPSDPSILQVIRYRGYDHDALNKDITVTLDLVRRAQGGDGACKERLIRRYYSRVRRIVRLRMDSRLRRHMDTCDILQETFVAAMSAFDNFDMLSESSFINWMSVIAERKVRDAVDHATAQRRDMKREVSMNQTGGTDMGSFAASLAEENRSPLSVMAIDEDTETLEELIRSLPAQQREVILLRNYAGSSWEEIANEMHKSSADAARMLHARAMVELSKRVQKGRQDT